MIVVKLWHGPSSHGPTMDIPAVYRRRKRTTEGLHIIFLGILGWGRLAGMETHNGLANQRCRKFGSAWKKAFRQEQIKDSSKQENIAQGEI